MITDLQEKAPKPERQQWIVIDRTNRTIKAWSGRDVLPLSDSVETGHVALIGNSMREEGVLEKALQEGEGYLHFPRMFINSAIRTIDGYANLPILSGAFISLSDGDDPTDIKIYAAPAPLVIETIGERDVKTALKVNQSSDALTLRGAARMFQRGYSQAFAQSGERDDELLLDALSAFHSAKIVYRQMGHVDLKTELCLTIVHQAMGMSECALTTLTELLESHLIAKEQVLSGLKPNYWVSLTGPLGDPSEHLRRVLIAYDQALVCTS